MSVIEKADMYLFQKGAPQNTATNDALTLRISDQKESINNNY